MSINNIGNNKKNTTANKGTNSNVEVRTLDLKNTKKYISDLVNMDKVTCEELGTMYSSDHWLENNFLHDLEGKWNYSFFAIDLACDRLVGFLICSKYLDSVHGHRMMVDKSYRGFQIARNFFGLVDSKAKSLGLKYYTTTVPYSNISTKEWYLSHDYNLLLHSNQLNWFIERKNKSAIIKEDSIEINQERFWVFRKTYEQN